VLGYDPTANLAKPPERPVDPEETTNGGQGSGGDGEEGAQVLVEAPASTSGGLDGDVDGRSATNRPTRRMVIVGAIVVVAALVVVALVLLISNVSNALSTGTGTATITWTPAKGTQPIIGNVPQPFGGSIKGTPVSGINKTTVNFKDYGSAFTSSKSTVVFQVFRLTGSLDGTAFNLGLDYRIHPKALANSQILVKGTYGSLAVTGTIAPPSAAQSLEGSPPLHFRGTVGDFKVSGIIYSPKGDANRQTARATFTVTK
jgi:hypothetical protein